MAQRRTYPRAYQWLVFVLSAALLAGCSAAQKLRHAQDIFSVAARQENREKFDTFTSFEARINSSSQTFATPAVEGVSSTDQYRRCIEVLDSLTDKEEGDLRADRLLGTRWMLEAMSHWRMGEGQAAEQDARTAMQLSDQLTDRETSLMQAIPGLVKIDDAYRLIPPDDIEKGTQTDQYNRVVGLLGPGIKAVRSARSSDADAPVNFYLIQCELAAYINLKHAHWRFDRKTFSPIERAEIKELLKMMNTWPGLTSQERQQITNVWSAAVGVGL